MNQAGRALAVALSLVANSAVAKKHSAGDAAPVAPKVLSAMLEDGTSLLLVPVPGAQQASFRYVVRAGSLMDPDQKVGLAHLLEHLIFHGSYDSDGSRFRHDVRSAGAYYNAFTSKDSTIYVLDSDRGVFLPLAHRDEGRA